MIAGRSIARIKVVPAIAVIPLRASQYSKCVNYYKRPNVEIGIATSVISSFVIKL